MRIEHKYISSNDYSHLFGPQYLNLIDVFYSDLPQDFLF